MAVDVAASWVWLSPERPTVSARAERVHVEKLSRILLVEDDANDIELTLAAFERNHFVNDVTVVRDGEEALNLLHRRGKYETLPEGNPQLILLDLKMPKVGGLEVLREIRASEHLCRIPVIVLTTSREDQDIVQSYDLGVNGYVVKPVEFQQFVEVVGGIGQFWIGYNEPPPGSLDPDADPKGTT